MTTFISGFVSPLCVVQILLYDVKLEQYEYIKVHNMSFGTDITKTLVVILKCMFIII